MLPRPRFNQQLKLKHFTVLSISIHKLFPICDSQLFSFRSRDKLPHVLSFLRCLQGCELVPSISIYILHTCCAHNCLLRNKNTCGSMEVSLARACR